MSGRTSQDASRSRARKTRSRPWSEAWLLEPAATFVTLTRAGELRGCIGTLSAVKISPAGEVVSAETWGANARAWLPTPEDRAYVQSLMGRVVEPGKFANWIAPPEKGINKQPVDFEYVRFN